MSNNIVTVNVSQTVAPAPSTLQGTGAFISQGGTTAAAQSTTLLTSLADLTAILTPAKALTSLAWSTNVVTVTTTAPHGWSTGLVFQATIAGCTPVAYNGTFTITVTGASTFTYPLTPNPGAIVTAGTVTIQSAIELTAMATTFFAQGSAVSIYVLELGAGSAAQGVTALTTYINANPGVIYSYLVPRLWSGESTFITYLASFEATTAKTYFFITATTGNYTSFTATMKCAFVMIEAATVPITEFSAAAPFYVTLHYAPSASNKVTPTAFSYLYGVTSYPTVGNSALRQTLKSAGVNIVGIGAEGGVSTAILLWGTTMDGNDFTYWYSVDWVQINVELDLANEIINGSNNPLAPLYYNQDGINRLQARAQATMNRGISDGLVLSPAPVAAVTFTVYTAENPSDYAAGTYNGLSVTYTPSKGFKSITFNVNVQNFPSA